MACAKLAGPLSTVERSSLGLIALVPVIFGIVVEVRGAFLQTRRTDLAVFARAAWSVRSGVDVYSVTDDKGLHYHYPPFLAILMAPLADPPPGVTLPGALPFAITVGVWYLLSVLAAFQSLHSLASALVGASPALTSAIGPRWSRGWWALRVAPMLVCLPYLGHSLVIGQINVLWMALTCWMAAALLRGQRFRAGLWLAAAICIKVIPAFLLLYPIWRRDRRCLAGALSGLCVGLVIVPVLFLGRDGAWLTVHRWADVMLLPVLGLGSDHSRDQELLGTWSTHNQGFATIIHKTLNVLSDPRPQRITPVVQFIGIFAGIILTCFTLFAAGWQRSSSRVTEVLCLGALNVNMLSLSPGGHPHYLILLVPLIAALLATEWEQGASIYATPALRAFMVLGVIASALPLIVQREGVCYDLGIPMLSALTFWSAACYRMWQQRQTNSCTRLSTSRIEVEQPRVSAA
jgi:hypothetical protein